jgi:exopolysaccharide biosynthesis polyprenyl glycosylphosphotransferase
VNPGPRRRRSVLTSAAIIVAAVWFGGCSNSIPPGDLAALSVVLSVVSGGALTRSLRFGMRQRRMPTRRIVILGCGQMAVKLLEDIDAIEGNCDLVAGVIDDRPLPEPWATRIRWLGAPAQLGEIVAAVRPVRIVVAVADRRDRLPLQLLLESRVRGVIVEDAMEFCERLTGKMAIEVLKPSALIHSTGFQNHGAAELAARAVSLVVAAVGLVVAAPLLAAIALAVKLDSRGPVLFVQQRAGRHGRPFGLLKFRTMHPRHQPGSEWVRDNEHRITRVGRWLRRFRLDEVPQLVNVLRGEMNLIGPRPHPTSNHEIFSQRIAYYLLRSTVRPGVTGWAQERYGYANNLEEETEKMRYDLYYIKNRSLWLDARILLHTILVVFGGHGATAVRPVAPRRVSPTRSHVALARSPEHLPKEAPVLAVAGQGWGAAAGGAARVEAVRR